MSTGNNSSITKKIYLSTLEKQTILNRCEGLVNIMLAINGLSEKLERRDIDIAAFQPLNVERQLFCKLVESYSDISPVRTPDLCLNKVMIKSDKLEHAYLKGKYAVCIICTCKCLFI